MASQTRNASFTNPSSSTPVQIGLVCNDAHFINNFSNSGNHFEELDNTPFIRLQPNVFRQLMVTESTPTRRPSRSGNVRNYELYKTALCDFWSNGVSCRFGDKCWFAHGPEELRIAQFVVPAGHPYSNTLDYEIRMRDSSQAIFASNNQFPAAISPSASRRISRAVGSERMANNRRIDHVSVKSNIFPFENLMDVQDSGFLSDRHSSGDSASEGDNVSPRAGAVFPDTNNQWHSPELDPFSEEYRQISKVSDIGFYDMWKENGRAALALCSSMESNDRQKVEQNDEKKRQENGEICDLYQWCGFCPMEESCPYAHYKS